MRKILRFEHKIIIVYLVVGGLWILFSDKMILLLTNDANTISQYQTLKGWFYVLVTAGLFFAILRWYILRLRKALDKSEESDRLKTAFLQNVSHEIRTPMNSICGFSTLLNKEGLTQEKRKQYTGIIINSSNQLLSIVNDILCISNIETGQESLNQAPVRIDTILDEIFEIFIPHSSGKGVALNLDIDESVKGLEVNTDGPKLKQVLWNLTSNAVKFTQKGTVTIGCNIENSNLNIYVSDTGIGIEPQMHEKIFDRFVQADSTIQLNYGGTGLGLSIAKGYTILLGGEISLQSEPSVGTRVNLSIPVDIQPSSKPKVANTTVSTVDKKQSKLVILVAEDEEFNFMYIEEMIKGISGHVIRAKNGQEAVDICSKNPDIDVVIMDLRMPVMNGYEATRQIKKFRPSLPIIAHTAYQQPEKIEEGSTSSFDEYLPKPLNHKTLRTLLSKYK
jgi:signal transduction histidine kinase